MNTNELQQENSNKESSEAPIVLNIESGTNDKNKKKNKNKNKEKNQNETHVVKDKSLKKKSKKDSCKGKRSSKTNQEAEAVVEKCMPLPTDDVVVDIESAMNLPLSKKNSKNMDHATDSGSQSIKVVHDDDNNKVQQEEEKRAIIMEFIQWLRRNKDADSLEDVDTKTLKVFTKLANTPMPHQRTAQTKKAAMDSAIHWLRTNEPHLDKINEKELKVVLNLTRNSGQIRSGEGLHKDPSGNQQTSRRKIASADTTADATRNVKAHRDPNVSSRRSKQKQELDSDDDESSSTTTDGSFYDEEDNCLSYCCGCGNDEEREEENDNPNYWWIAVPTYACLCCGFGALVFAVLVCQCILGITLLGVFVCLVVILLMSHQMSR